MSAVPAIAPSCDRPPRTSTLKARHDAVERAILHIRREYSEPMSLHQLAAAAMMSPYHLHRVFVDTTGVSPGRFLAATRMDAAKRLLADPGRRITDVCYDVGYNSLGTFTTQFTSLVGLRPRRFRELARTCRDLELDTDVFKVPPLDGVGRLGSIVAVDEFQGWACVGVFGGRIPQGLPHQCAMTTVPGRFRIPAPIPQATYLLAVAMPYCLRPQDLLFPDQTKLHVGWIASRPLPVTDQRTEAWRLVVAPPRPTDPPVVLALPLLFALRAAAAIA